MDIGNIEDGWSFRESIKPTEEEYGEMKYETGGQW